MSKITNENGNKVWRNEARKYHRVDGPAVIFPNGSQAWFINGLFHRLDGPAYILPDGTQQWWVDGLLHRLDGPAIISSNAYKAWWVGGFRITDQVDEWIKENKFPVYSKWKESHKMMFLLAFSGNKS